MWRRRILALCVGLLIALVLIEGGFRITGVSPPKPVSEGQRESVRNRIGLENLEERNSLGFHDYEWEQAKPEGVWRVLVLGDSFTENSRVPLDETFVKLVERSLNAHAPTGRSYELFSVSRGGWGTGQEFRELMRMVDYEPDAVLVVYFINDATAIGSNPTLAKELNDVTMNRDGWLNRVSHLWDWLDYNRRRMEVTEITFRDYHDSFLGSEHAQERWRASKKVLRKMNKFTSERGIRMGLVLFPVLVQLREDHDLIPLYDMVLEHCRELELPAESLLPAFYGRDAESMWVSLTNSHPNSEANALVVEPIEEFLRREELVPR